MQFLRIIVFGATALWLLLGLVDWASAKGRYNNKPVQQQVEYDPEVLKDYQQRFGKSKIGEKYLKSHHGTPKMVGTKVGDNKSTVDQILEMPVLPKTVGGFPYHHKYKWGKQPTLTEQLRRTPVGPVRLPFTKNQ